MPSVARAPATHSQPSRKSKRAWRKNVDLTTIEAGLEAARDEAILTGGQPLSSVDDSNLFQTDTAGSTGIRNAARKAHKVLRADEILAERSAIAAINTHKRANSSTADGTGASDSTRKRRRVSRAELQRLQKLAYSTSLIHTDHLHPDETATHDPWALTTPDSSTSTAVNANHPTSFLPTQKPITAPRTLKQPPTSLARSGAQLPSIPLPNPGRSYNPSYSTWARLLAREGAKEVAAEQRRRAAATAEAERAARSAAIAEAVDRAEACAETGDASKSPQDAAADASESEWEGCASDAELRAKRPARKTPAERNRAKRRKAAAVVARQEEAAARRETAERAWMRAPSSAATSTVDGAQELVPSDAAAETHASLSDSDSDSDSDSAHALRRRPIRASAPLQLAAHKGQEDGSGAAAAAVGESGRPRAALPPAPLELVLPDELAGSLRQLRPQGNLLAERWRSQMERGKIEGRLRPAGVGRARRAKVVEKWSYRDWRLEGRGGAGVIA